MNPKLFHLSRRERDELERRYKQEREKRVAQRIQGILLLHEGKSAREVAKLLMVSQKTVKRWVKVLVRYGIEGLCRLEYENSGRERKLSQAEELELEQYLDEQVRSTKEVMDHLEKRYGVQYSAAGVLKLLKRMDDSYKKPKVIPSKADIEKQRAFWRVYEVKRAGLEGGGRVYFIDAAHLLHTAVAGYGWIKRGQEVGILTNSGRNRLNVLGAYSPDDHSLISLEGVGSCDAEMVKNLLSQMRAAHPGGERLRAILDNARYQHNQGVKDWAEGLNIELLYLPPYSPNLNLIERFWKFLRKEVLRKYYPTFEEFVAAIKGFLGNLEVYEAELRSLMTENFHLLDAA